MAGTDAFGTSLSRGDGAEPEVFTAIANITALTPPGISRETLDVTAHDSPDGYMEFIGGLKDAGEVSFDVRYDPSVHDVLVDDFEAAEPIDYEVAFPDGTVWAFSAILTGFESDAPYDDVLSASLTLKVSGKPVITPAV